MNRGAIHPHFMTDVFLMDSNVKDRNFKRLYLK